MSASRRYELPTPHPVELHVESGQGSVSVRAEETAETRVVVTGASAGEVVVDHSGDRVQVVTPKRRGFGGGSAVRIEVTLPPDSTVSVSTGSADVVLEGPVGLARLQTGSGSISAAEVRGALQVKSGSGRVRVAHAAEAVAVSTGSGDVDLGTCLGPVVVKTGSGDQHIAEPHADVLLATGSGDLALDRVRRGKVGVKGASGDLRIGIPAGVPVWTDISTVSGRIRSALSGTGEPREGQDHVELRASTVSGDVVLVEV